MKKCSMCKKCLPKGNFNLSSRAKEGLQTRCRECSSKACSIYRENNPSKVKKYNQGHASRNPEYSKEWTYRNKERKRIQGIAWTIKNREKIREAKKARLQTSDGREIALSYKRRRTYQLRISTPIYTCTKSIKLFKLLSPEGMEVDHIIPINHPLVCGLNCLQNMQYLTSEENYTKAGKFDGTYENDSWRNLIVLREKIKKNISNLDSLLPAVNRIHRS